jgi:peptidyl-tRNA hydrolase ICT1
MSHSIKLYRVGIGNFSTCAVRTQFRSSVSLDKLYPCSERQGSTTEEPKTVGNEFSGFIPINELKIKYSLSSGPGGQNVNKVATKVDIRFHISSANWLSKHVKETLLEKYSNQLTKDGWMVVKSDRTRSQTLNQTDALEKLRQTIRSSLIPPPPTFTDEEREKMTKHQITAARERLKHKRI